MYTNRFSLLTYKNGCDMIAFWPVEDFYFGEWQQKASQKNILIADNQKQKKL